MDGFCKVFLREREVLVQEKLFKKLKCKYGTMQSLIYQFYMVHGVIGRNQNKSEKRHFFVQTNIRFGKATSIIY